MKELKVLLYRDWLEFKKKYISYILLWFSLPMIFYLFLVFPLSKYFFKVDLMIYENWSSPGIWICSSAILSFTYSFMKLRNLLSKEELINKYLKAPLSNGQLLFSLLITSITIGFIQLCIAILITISLNNDSIASVQFLIILLNVVSSIIFFSILGLFSLFISKMTSFQY